ncbi:hypothetical protein [Brachyspira pulli]|uniref:hypothetical protein n=1 Tax=Brachyspira pulli TaxID=310721 RepID=UPI003005E342
MNKKLLTIFLSLFLVGILSVSCSNKDKTAPDTGTPSTPKTIDPKYSGIWSSSVNPDAVEIDINGNIYEYKNSSRGTKGEIIEANGPTYKVKIYNDEVTIKFTDENNATVTTKDGEAPYTKTSKGIQQINGNSYVSESAIMGSLYLWVSVKDSKVGMSGGNDQTSEPQYQGYFSVTGSGTDYSFSTDYYGQPNAIEGTLKFASDGSTVTVNYSKNPAMSSIEGKNIVCNIKK